jgi:hypothetical protein
MTRRAVDETALTRALRALADEEARIETPAHLEASLLARWDEHRRTPRASRARTRTFVRGAATMAAGVVLFGAVVLRRELEPVRIDPPRSPTVSVDTGHVVVPPNSAERGAVAAPDIAAASTRNEPRSTVVLVGAPMTNGELVQVVRMRVDRAALSELGITQSGSTETVEVDVLIGEDGVARGLRLPL